ncbi:MAG: phenylacetate-CoA oxygenase/reductase subunit PaaK [Burkholderiales bacterium]|nr:phenylacetate-CoA oxygenase/reductase subunit PaaK [Burkholderiales bacterium]
MATHFHSLAVKRVAAEAAGAAAITFEVPPALREAFDFQPGQFLTLRTTLGGAEVRRSYSVCSAHSRYAHTGEIEVGIKPVEGGAFSRWATGSLKAGDTLDVMPPDGRFTPRIAGARHRVGFAAGSGITPLLSIIATTLEAEPASRFTLVYGNQRVNSIMFNEALQDLKDKYPARLTLMHVLSRQPQEAQLFNGRIDEAKAGQLLAALLPADGIDEAFVCGPEGMIEGVQRALLAAGVPTDRVHCERFLSGAVAPESIAAHAQPERAAGHFSSQVQLEIVLDGKTHHLSMGPQDKVLDVALEAGLDLPYSCRGGVCCTCRARVLEGEVAMEKNFTLEKWETDKGFVLTCQSRPLGRKLVVSYDER